MIKQIKYNRNKTRIDKYKWLGGTVISYSNTDGNLDLSLFFKFIY